jgi:hypothetical protein
MFKPPGGMSGGGDEEDEKLETGLLGLNNKYDGGLRNLFRINQSINGKVRISVRA